MASGINHLRGTLLITVPAGLLAAGLGAGPAGAVACSAGCLAGIILSPDLDVPSRTHSEYLVYRALGRFFGAVWFAFWWLYARLIPHRSPLSHFPLIGTFSRFLYVYLLGGVLWYGATSIAGSPAWIPLFEWLRIPVFSWAIVVLDASDTLHYLMDFLPFLR